MNSIERLFNVSDNFEQFTKGYFDYLHDLLKRLDVSAVKQFIDELEDARKEQQTVFFIGNGGSAATASHMVNDFGMGSPFPDEDLPFRVISLASNISAITATANDTGYDNIFTRQLAIYFKPGDKLVAISASGNSPNIIAAAQWVKDRKGRVIGLLGFDGGKLKQISDIVIHVKTPKDEYGPVEDIHMILNHLIYTWIWFKKRKGQLQ